ncbi:segregation and condensation protein A [Roseiflexus sp.]|uniref:segregation and condensation protein A n=1 Tax=Roseiflexus sp. TaxID=2562120 RepID=UPI00398A8282
MTMFVEPIDYTVTLPIFEGPLDLLLRLIEREELDVTSVALAHVADQYLAHVRAMDAPDPASLSAFLVMAARLLLLKSRALLPRPAAAGDQEPDDEGDTLVRQLQEYQRFRQLASLLRLYEGRRMYTRLASPPAPRSAQLDHTVADLIVAMQRRMQLTLPLDPPPVALPAPKIVTVSEMIDRIHAGLQARPWIAFEEIISLTAHRIEIIVAFWAVLELWKRRAIVVEQTGLFGVIVIRRGVVLEVENQALRTES